MRLAPLVLDAAALASPPREWASLTCPYRIDYVGEITRIQVMHHNLTHETIPFRSTATTGSDSLTLTRLP